VYFNGRLCKKTIAEEIEQIVNGVKTVKIIQKPHPMYLRAADIRKTYDEILDANQKRLATTNTITETLNSAMNQKQLVEDKYLQRIRLTRELNRNSRRAASAEHY
jgi:hypothetical protein